MAIYIGLWVAFVVLFPVGVKQSRANARRKASR